MRKFAIFIILPLLVACMENSELNNYAVSRTNRYSSPQNPTTDFSDQIAENNKRYTGMVSNTDDMISRYVTYRLNKFSDFNPNVGTNISNMDVAAAMVYLTDRTQTAADLEKHFANNMELMHMAVYAIDNRLNRCFAGGGYGCGRVFYKVA